MKERIYSFDILKAIAIIGVVFIHVNSYAYAGEYENSFNYNLNVIFRQIVNCSVPLFLFISGFFMAKKEIRNKKEFLIYIQKALNRVLIPFLIWSTFYSVFHLMQGESIESVLKKMALFQASVPFYYILLIVQYYLLQPLLKRIGKSKTGVFITLFISLFFCFAFEVLKGKYGIQIPFIIYAGNFIVWSIFPVLGIYVKLNRLSIKVNYFFVASLFFLIVSIFHTLYLAEKYNNTGNAITAIKSTSFLFSITFILLLYKLKDSFVYNKAFVKLGELSFGIYFMHMFVLQIIMSAFSPFFSNGQNANILVQLVIVISVILVCTIFGICLRKINKAAAAKYLGF